MSEFMVEIFIVSFLIVLVVVLTMAFMYLSEKSVDSREKSSPYECGFDPFLSARSSFSLRFFLLAVLFVVFDVELSLLVPVVYCTSFCSSFIGLVSALLFMLVLFLGLFHEYREGSLNWIL